jgi:pimeloyl-ACP methyl ester carboxylesterase
MSTTSERIQSTTLKVPGASLYYEEQGAGPLLLMIPGGPTDAGIFAPLAAQLADRYQVVRYDPRGNSRSVLDGPPADQDMDVHGDDAARLLAELGSEPAFVLGSSGGAQIGLNLAARHPERVHTLVAHEPPCLLLLDDAEESRSFNESVYEAYRTAGAGAAMQKFMVGTGLAGEAKPTAPPPAELQEALQRIRGNLDYFLGHGLKPIGFYVPDVARLQTGPARVVVGIGEASAGGLAGRSAIALAKRLGSAPVSFPGGHGGYNDAPAIFADRLDGVLRGTPIPSTQP